MDIRNTNKVTRVTARRRLLPGIASKYISPFSIRPGDRVVLALRVSGRLQGKKKNLRDQETSLRRLVKEHEGTVVAVVKHVGPGTDPWWIGTAAALAATHGACILAESTDRYIRHPSYHSKLRPRVQARESDINDLKYFAGDCKLMTYLHPDASPGDVRTWQIKRGQTEKNNKGGRPRRRKSGYYKKRRIEKLPVARELWAKGYSLQAISNKTGVPRPTIQTWVSGHW